LNQPWAHNFPRTSAETSDRTATIWWDITPVGAERVVQRLDVAGAVELHVAFEVPWFSGFASMAISSPARSTCLEAARDPWSFVAGGLCGNESRMGGAPLVSIMMPCFNAERTLPMALASLRAQTYENWEALVVDDGSSDRTWDLLQGFGDPRLRLERFDRNRGRGAARQRCLEMASGALLSFLDADDWLFPEKLGVQVPLMEEHPEVVVLSGACVITDANGEPVGLTRTGLRAGRDFAVGLFARPGPPPLSFPPSMVRMAEAQSAGFDPNFRRSQDSDFLIRVMLGKRYAVSSIPVYAYSQAEAASLSKTLEGYRYRFRCYGQYRKRFPLRARSAMAKTVARMGVYKVAGWLHAEQRLIERRWARVTPESRDAYTNACELVTRVADMGAGS